MNCRCCGGDRLELVLDLHRQPWGNDFIPQTEDVRSEAYPLELFFCHDCTMVQIGYTVPKEKMFVDHRYVSGTTKSLTRHFEEVRDRILARVDFGADDYVLDVGGNDGTFLSTFLPKGVKVLNVDSGRLQAQLSEKAGVACLNDFFNEETALKVLEERGPARVIHGSGVFFHLEELHSAFAGIKKLLAEDGVVVAEFIYLPGMVRSCAFDQIYHEHLVYYTVQSFNGLLRRHGLEITDAELVPIHGGSCIAYITHAGARAKTDALEAIIADEVAGGFDTIDAYRAFARRTEALRDTVRALIGDAHAKGLRIQALGAPVKGSTIMNYCGFDETQFECAVEINDLKCGTWFPGTRIPVLHQNAVEAPDLYFMLSWNFKDEILAKLADFRAKGGKVLIPVPEPHIV